MDARIIWLTTWMCMFMCMSTTEVPIIGVNVTSPSTSPVTVTETITSTFVCDTSPSRPQATIRWYKKSDNGPAVGLGAGTITTAGSNASEFTRSTLQYVPTRGDHGYRIYCTAYNLDHTTLFTSANKPYLYVQYAPANPAISGYASGTNFKVLAGTPQILTCIVQGGRPLANLSWSCFSGTVQGASSGDIVFSQVRWTAALAHNGQKCTCQASQPLWSSPLLTYVVIETLYPPSAPTFTVQGQPVSGSVSVIEGRDVSVICSSSGNPPPGYSWTPRESSASTDTLTLTNVQTSDQRDYTCEATNTMRPSQGSEVSGTSSAIVSLNVLYPPSAPTFTVQGQPVSGSVSVIEGRDVSVICSSSGNPPPGYSWTPRGSSASTDTLTLTNVQTSDQRDYTCKATNTMRPSQGSEVSGTSSAIVSLNVLLPIIGVNVTSPTTSPVTVTENITSTFVCETSPSRPQATIRWYKKSDNGPAVGFGAGTISSAGSNASEFTRSTLQYVPTRSDHGYMMYCTAYNIDPTTLFTSSNKPYLYVQYAPANPAITGYASGTNFKVLAGTTQTLTCIVQGGRPLANLSWSCFSGTVQDTSSGDIVSSQVRWTAALAHNGQKCTCQASQPLWSSPLLTYVVIETLYPPSAPTFTVQGQPVSRSVSVIEGRDVSVICSSSGNPPPGYSWTPRGSSMSTDTLTLTNIQTSDPRDYTCKATNTMRPSQGSEVSGTSSAIVSLNVLYAPVVNSLSIDTAIENREFTKTCSYTSGNPPATVIEWTKPGNNTVISRDTTLTISKVIKASSGNYTCTAKNTMMPTGESAVIGTHLQTFQLEVYYSASLTSFNINSQSEAGPFTYDENSTITVKCEVYSNPGSQITLARDGVALRTFKNTREATHDVTMITCLDAGMYSCTAHNPYNENSIPKMTKQVFVRCPPRPFNTEYNKTYYYDVNDDVTLNIEFTAYPAPTAYRWYKQRPDKSWVHIALGHADNSWTAVTVEKSSSVRHANLTITNIKEYAFGQYRVHIFNDLGTLEHSFFVAKQEVLEAPVSSSPLAAISGGVGAALAIVVVAVVIVIVIVRRRRAVLNDGENLTPSRTEQVSNLPSDHQYYNAAFHSGLEYRERDTAATVQQYEALQTTRHDSQLYDQLHQTQGDATNYSNRSTYEQLDHSLRRNDGVYDGLNTTAGTSVRGDGRVYVNLKLRA